MGGPRGLNDAVATGITGHHENADVKVKGEDHLHDKRKEMKLEEQKSLSYKAKRDIQRMKNKILEEVKVNLSFLTDVSHFKTNENSETLHLHTEISDIQKNKMTISIEENMQKRLITVLSRLMSKIICELDIFNPAPEEKAIPKNNQHVDSDEVKSMFQGSQTMYQRRMSTKTDIKSFLESASSTNAIGGAIKASGNAKGKIKEERSKLMDMFLDDCSFGSFNNDDILLYIFRWTTEGYVSKLSQTQKQLVKSQMLHAVKKMAGTVALQKLLNPSFFKKKE